MAKAVRRESLCPGLPTQADAATEFAVPEPASVTRNPWNFRSVGKGDGTAGSFLVNQTDEEGGGVRGVDAEIACPACGRPVDVGVFREHLEAERHRLRQIVEGVSSRRLAIGALCDAVTQLKSLCGKADLQSWRDASLDQPLSESFAYLDGLGTEALNCPSGMSEFP